MRRLRIFLGSLLLLLVLVAGTGYFLRVHLQKLVLHRLLTEIETTFGQYYHLDFGQLETSIDFRHFSIRVLRPVFTTDTTQLAYLSKYPPVYFKADSLLIKGLNLRSLFLGKNISLREIQLSNPSLLLLTRDSSLRDSLVPSPKNKRKLIQSIRLGLLRIEDGDVRIVAYKRPTDTVYYGEAIRLTLTSARLPLQAPGRVIDNLRLENLVYRMNKVLVQPLNSPYAFEMQELHFDFAGDSMHCRDLKLLPERSLLKLSRQARFQKTFAKIALGDMAVYGIYFKELSAKKLQARKVVLQDARFFLLRNKAKKPDGTLVKKSFRENLAALPFSLFIDSLQLVDMTLEFQLYMPGKTLPAIIRLTKANALITHLHNHPDSSQLTLLKLKSNIMERGKLRFEASFTPGKQVHAYQGHIAAMPFSDWNQVIGQMAPVNIEGGQIDGIDFTGEAGDMETKGTILFRYHDLKAGIWKVDKDGHQKKARILSATVNMLLHQNNPAVGKKEAESKRFFYRREPWQGPVMLWIGGLLDGMEATLLSEKNKARVAEAKQKKKAKPD